MAKRTKYTMLRRYRQNNSYNYVHACTFLLCLCSDLLYTDAKTHFIKVDSINKGTDAVNLPSILRSKLVIETVPTYFKEKEPPIVSYAYTKTIANKIFNFSSTLADLDYHQFHNNPSQCECNTLCIAMG